MYIYGKQPVYEVLTKQPELVMRLYTGGKVKDTTLAQIREIAQRNHIAFNTVAGKKMVQMVGEVNDQGIVAELKEFPYTDIDQWLGSLDMETKPSAILLDEVQDVHNVGAIIRTAAAAGMSAVLLPEHRQAPVNSTVFKTSAGAVLSIPVIRIGNVNQAMRKLQDAGFWTYGLVQDGQTNLMDYVHDSASIFVVGSEGHGIRAKTRELCDYGVSIPMADGVESLNASVSAALCMYEVMRKKNS